MYNKSPSQRGGIGIDGGRKRTQNSENPLVKRNDLCYTKGMEQIALEQLVKKELEILPMAGFVYESAYDKSTDTSCVYIHRFKRGGESVEIRTVTGGKKMSLVIYSGGEYRFPDLFKLYKKETASFRLSHLIHKASEEELWRFFLSLMKKECEKGSLFGIDLPVSVKNE